jgi:2-aminoadipate transaminase
MVEAKGIISINTSFVTQYAGAKLFQQGIIDKQIDKMCKIYRKKRDVMLETIAAYFPKEAKWSEPKGGLFLWVELPEHVNATEMLIDALQRGVAYIPGSNFFVTETHNHIRLNYSHPSIEDIVEGIQILGRLLKEKI